MLGREQSTMVLVWLSVEDRALGLLTRYILDRPLRRSVESNLRHVLVKRRAPERQTELTWLSIPS